MKCLPVVALCLPLVLSGCSTLSAIQWSKAWLGNWFSTRLALSDKGLGDIHADTPLDQQTLSEALGGDYRVRSGMKTANGTIVSFYEALRDGQPAVIVEGEQQKVSRITVLDPTIETSNGVKLGTVFSDLYHRAYGVCSRGSGDDAEFVVCKAPGSQHLNYLFAGQWHGPQGLIPADDMLKTWKLSKMVWVR